MPFSSLAILKGAGFFRPNRMALVALSALAFAVARGADPSPSASPQPSPAQPRTLKPEDFAALRDVDEPNISRDGTFIAYVVKTTDATGKFIFTDEEWHAFVLDFGQAWIDDVMTSVRERFQEFREDQEEDE